MNEKQLRKIIRDETTKAVREQGLDRQYRTFHNVDGKRRIKPVSWLLFQMAADVDEIKRRLTQGR